MSSVSNPLRFLSFNLSGSPLNLQFYSSFPSICCRQTVCLQHSPSLQHCNFSISLGPSTHPSLHPSIHPITSPSILASPIFQVHPQFPSHAPSRLGSRGLISTSCVSQRREYMALKAFTLDNMEANGSRGLTQLIHHASAIGIT